MIRASTSCQPNILFWIFGFMLLVPVSGWASTKNDSLWSAWSDTSLADTSRLKAIHKLAWNHIFSNPDSAFSLAEQELSFATESQLPYWRSKAFHIMGTTHYVKGDYDKALEYYHKRLVETEQINDRPGLASSYNNIGNIYRDMGKALQAVDYYQQSLKIKIELDDKEGIASSYANLAVVYNDQKDSEKALEYNEKAIALLEEEGNKYALGNAYNNMGIVYDELKQYDKALECHLKSLALREEMENMRGIMHSYANIGVIYMKKYNYAQAMEYYNKVLVLAVKMGNKQALASAYHNIGSLYGAEKKYSNAIEFCLKGFAYAREINALKQLRDNCKCLSKAYDNIGNKAKAYSYYKDYISYRDSIRNTDRDRDLARKEFQYEYELKTTADSIRNAQIKKVQDAILMAQKAKLREEETIRYALYSGLAVVGVFLIILFNRFKLEKEQKKTIEKKNKSITDSIRYAQRIQNAVLPDDEKIDELLPDSFVFFRPKDMVSGDFYWVAEKDNKTFFAACDCTGHGVPGAFMSMIGTSLLNEAVNEKGLYQPAQILDEVRRGIINSLQQSVDKKRQDDGMDVSLCVMDKKSLQLEYAGAYNHLWRVKDGNIEIVKGDMQPIGYHRKQKPFTNHTLQLKKGECVYIFSDGYMDQFGGPDRKKFGFNAFSELILSMQSKSMADQYTLIEDGLDRWKGSQDQVDDILVMGVRA